MLKRDQTTSSNMNNYSTLNSEHNQENLRIQLRKSTNTHFQRPYLNQRKSNSQSDFCICFFIDSLMQHKCCCVILARKMNRITPTHTHTLCPKVCLHPKGIFFIIGGDLLSSLQGQPLSQTNLITNIQSLYTV